MLGVVTGRSRRLWPQVVEEMGKALSEGAERLLLLTPDQYTLQAELELTERLSLPGLLQMEVLSPQRLLMRVFALAGSPRRVRIDARGKSMVLSDVLRLRKSELTYYRRAANRRGFTERLSGCIADFKRAGMTPEAVQSMCDALPEGDALREKLADVALLYEAYASRLEGAFIDGEDVQEAFLHRLPESGMLDGLRIWIYGFDLISPQFARQIAVMAKGAISVRLALTWETENARDGLVFQPARDTLARLARHLDAQGLQWEHAHMDVPLAAHPDIAHLERELFAMPQKPYLNVPSAVTVWGAANPYDEVARTAAAMRIYARRGYRFADMAVVVGDLDAYTGAIESEFGRSEIPYHMARKRPALSHPLLRAWLAALRCATKGFRQEDALAFLKSGFSGLAREEAERLENYAIEHGLRGKKWQKPMEDAELEDTRERFVTPLLSLREGLREARDATQTLAAAYSILPAVEAYEQLMAWSEQLEALGHPMEAADCAQAWRLALETLDQLHALLHGSRLPMAEIADIIGAGLSEAELGSVPQRPGTVQVGQLGHVKLGGGCKILFLMGMQDGVLSSAEASLLTEQEAQRAAEAASDGAGLRIDGAAFGLRGDALAQMMQINLLDTIAAPEDLLIISHAMASVDGAAQRPASVLSLIEKLFPNMEKKGGITRGEQKWHAPGAALDALGSTLRQFAEHGVLPDEQTKSAAVWLLSNEKTRDVAERVMKTLTTERAIQPIGKQAARRLYARDQTSVSRLEAFAHCPYMHFITYGLRPAIRRDFVPQRNEIGSFYHQAMEGFAKAAADMPMWPNIDRDANDALMDTVLSPLREAWEGQPLSDNAMLRAAGDGFCRVARRAAWTYTGQMRRGAFKTEVIEARFGVGEALPPIVLKMPDGQTRWLEGRIDRIDFYAEQGEKWLRVVDYKSGKAQLEPSKLYGGLQLQLMLYLMAALSGFEGVNAAGVFYSRFDDPLILTDSRDIDQIEREIAKELQLAGICVSDVRVVKALEDGSAMLNRDGSIGKAAGAAPADALAGLMRHAHALATELSSQILAGEIAQRPAQLDAWKACDWCECRPACGFDIKAKGNHTRRLEKLTRDALYERVLEGER